MWGINDKRASRDIQFVNIVYLEFSHLCLKLRYTGGGSRTSDPSA